MNLRKTIALLGVFILGAALTATGASAGAKGKQIGKLSAKQCSAEKKALGNEAFTEVYGSPAMPACLGVKDSELAPVIKGSSKECKAERADIGVEAFKEKYGSNKNKKNAFGKCVSRKAAPEAREESAKVLNAAKVCAAERSDPGFAAGHDGKTFDEFYGTNKNLKNAFGKCVSGKAHEAPEPEPTA